MEHPDWIIFDCRFTLTNTEAGGLAYRNGHIRVRVMCIWIMNVFTGDRH